MTLDISETPVFVTIAPKEKQVINGKGKRIKPEAISLNADFSGEVCDLTAAPNNQVLNLVYRILDEPETMPEYIYGDTAALEKPVTNATVAIFTAYVKLDRPYVLNGVGVYDTYGTGNVSVYDAHTDRLLWSTELDSYMSRDLEMIDETAATDMLKIVKGGSGDFNELAFYGYAVSDNHAEITALRRWLLTQDKSLADWRTYDLNADGKLDVRDLTLMKRKLPKK